MMRKRSNGDVGKPKNAFKLKGKIETIPDELGIEVNRKMNNLIR